MATPSGDGRVTSDMTEAVVAFHAAQDAPALQAPKAIVAQKKFAIRGKDLDRRTSDFCLRGGSQNAIFS
jgi:hypothetical protein